MEQEAIKKLTAEMRKALEEKISSKEFSDFKQKMAETKVEDTGEFEMIISTEHKDRSGEVVVQDGINIENYMRNPIVLWAHDYSSMPVAITDSIRKDVVNGVKCTIAKGRFAPTAFGQELRKMYEQKFQNTSSIGFMGLEGKYIEVEDVYYITKSELLEWSFVPVPCNSFAERMKAAGINIEMLKEKGFTFDKKEGEAVNTEVVPPVEEVKPEEEKPAEEKPEEKKEEVKGEVADEVAEGDMQEQKFKKLDEVFEIINAFIDVYLDENTPVENFSTLLGETAQLLADYAKNPVDDETAEKILKAKAKIKTSLLEKLLSLKNKNAALEVEKPEGSDEPEKPEGEEALKQRSGDAKVEKELLESFLQTQAILRTVNQATSEGLAHLKKKLREIY